MHSEPASESRFETAPPDGAVRLESVASRNHLILNTLIVSARAAAISRQMRSRALQRRPIAPMAIGAVPLGGAAKGS
jgi:hypothetical protein